MVALPYSDNALMPLALSGPVVTLPNDVTATSPPLSASMPKEPLPVTETFPNDVRVIGAKVLAAFIPVELLPVVTMFPYELIVMAPSVVP